MAARRKRGRRSVLRGSRTYVVCGFIGAGKGPRFVWLPGATLLLVVLCSAFAAVHKTTPPPDPQRELPVASVAHYTAEDFFTSVR